MLRAIEALVGAVVGVGIFGLPYAFAQAGFVIGLAYLLALGTVMVTVLLMFSEVVLVTPGRHHLSGYVRTYFGAGWGKFAAFLTIAGNWGALVAYVLVGGQFAYSLLSPLLGGELFLYQVVFMMVGFLVTLRGLSFISRVEMYLVAALVLAILALAVGGVPHVAIEPLLYVSSSDAFLPYGVVLFAIGGISLVPEMRDILGKHASHLRRVVPWSYVVIVALYTIFAFTVVSVTGLNTSPEAIAGFGKVVGQWALFVGALMGFLAVTTSFFLVSVSSQDLLELDYGSSRLLAWFATLSVPAIVILLGVRDFVEVMGFTGAVFSGGVAIFAVALFLRVRARRGRRGKDAIDFPSWAGYLVAAIFVIGIALELGSNLLERL